jgi:cytochrome P450
MLLRFVDAAILAIAAWQALRLAFKPPFRRDLAALPPLALLSGVLAVAALASVGVWALARWPGVLHLTAFATLVVMAAAWWRARPTYSRRRGWPPGSLGIGASLDAINDRSFYLDQARAHGPVFKMSQFGRPVLCVVGLARARDLLQGQPDALAGAALPYNRFVPQGMLRYMSAADHEREGPLFRRAFSSLELDQGEAAIRSACRTTLLSLSEASGTTSEGAYAREYFEQFLLAALCRVFFALEPDDARVADVGLAMDAMVVNRIGGPHWRRRMEGAFVRVTDLMRDLAREREMSGDGVAQDSLLGSLLAADPTALGDPTRVRNLIFACRLAHGDLTGLLDWLFAHLSDNPEWQRQVNETPRAAGAPVVSQPSDVGSRVVLESLRMEQSEYLYRRVVRPIDVEGYHVPAGWLLRICVQESHRDAAIFADPNRFNPDRFLGRTYNRSEYSPFGADVHGCMGSQISLFIGRLFVEELCHGFRWSVTHDGPLERGSRHRHHWRPSASKRVVVQSLGERELTPA